VQASSDNIWMEWMQRGEQVLRTLFDTPQYNVRLALGVNLLLITLIAYSAANLSWQLFSSFTVPEQTVAVSRSVAPPAVQPTLAGVPDLHVFGEADVKPVVSNEPINAPETRLRLVLHGVFASNIPERSMALIAEKSGKDKSYFIGDSLPGNATLHEVYSDRVILRRLGKLETLRLKEPAAEAEIGRRGKTRQTSSRSSRPRNSAKLKTMQELYKTDPQKVFSQLRITPVSKDGTINGYRFSHNDRALMREIGLTTRDVITAVNGVSVSDSGKLFAMMQDLDKLQEVNLTILRNGQTQNVVISTR
jgi:general secretion pathway protein C